MSRSKSSSSTSTKQTTTQIDRRIAATDEALVVNLEQGAGLTVTDAGATQAALDAAQASGQAAFEFAVKALGFAQDQTKQGFQLAQLGLEAAISEQERTVKKLITAGVVVGVVALGVRGLKAVK